MTLKLVSSLVDVLAGLSQLGVELVSLLVELLAGLSEVGLERVSSPPDALAGPSRVGFKRVSSLLDVLAGLSQVGLGQVSSPLDVLAGPSFVEIQDTPRSQKWDRETFKKPFPDQGPLPCKCLADFVRLALFAPRFQPAVVGQARIFVWIAVPELGPDCSPKIWAAILQNQ